MQGRTGGGTDARDVGDSVSEARFHALAESAPVGVLYVDTGGAVRYANARWHEITGLPAADTFGPEAARVVHPEDRERVMRSAGDALRAGREVTLEYRILRDDGTTRWVRGQASPVRSNGDTTGFVAAIADVTVEVEAQRGAEWLGGILAATTDYAVITDATGRTHFMNQASRELYGLARDADLDGFDWDDHLPEWARKLTAEEVLPTLLDRGVWVGESALLAADGREVPVSVVTVTCPAAGGDGNWFATIARDISRLKAVEHQLASSEARFRSMLQYAADLVDVRGADGSVRYISPSVEDVLGYTPEQLASMQTLELVHPDDRDAFTAVAKRLACRPGGWEDIEYRIRHRDGSWRWLESRIANLLDDPDVRGIVTSSWEETDRALALARGAESEQVLQAIVASSPVGIFAVEPDGTTRIWNQACERIFGWTAEEVLGKRFPLTTSPDPAHKAELRRRYARGETLESREVPVRRKDGTEVYITIATAPLRGPDGRVNTVMGVIADSTERHEAVAALQGSEERFRSLVQHSSDFVMVWDKEARITYLSPSTVRFFDGTMRVGDPAFHPHLLHPDDVDRVVEFFQELQTAGGATRRIEYRMRAADGALHWLESTATNLLDDPAVEGVVLNTRDVTERVEAANSMRGVNEALRRSNDTLSAIYENSPLAIYAFDADGAILFWNPACEQIFGWSSAEAVGRFSPPIREEDLESFRVLRDQVMAGQVVAVVEARRATKDRGEIDVLFSAAPLRDGSGSTIGVLALTADISAQRRAEGALHQSEEAFRALVEYSSDIVTVLEPDGTWRTSSAGGTRLLGWPKGFETEGGVLDFIHPDDVEAAADALAELADGRRGPEDSIVLRVRATDGTYRYLDTVGQDLRDHPAVNGFVLNSRDVTERHEAEEAVRRSEERFRALAQNAYDMITVLEADGTVLYASPSAARVMGYAEGWGLGVEHFDLIHPDDADEVARVFELAVATPGQGPSAQVRIRHADGTWRWIEAVANNLLDVPEVGGIVITARDVTEKRAAEAAVRESEERFRALVRHASDVIAVVDCEGVLRYVSPSIEQMLGYADHDILGTSALDLTHPDDATIAADALAETRTEPRSDGPTELRVRHADGSWRQVEIIGTNRLDDPAIQGTILNIRDVTERKRSDEALRASERRYRAIVEDQTELLIRYRRDGTITFVNEAYARAFESTVAELVGFNWVAVLDEEKRAKAEAMFAALTPSNPVLMTETAVELPDGRVQWQQWMNRIVLDERGQPVEYQGVGRDITEKRAAEALVAEQARVLELIAQSAPLDEVLTEICQVVESHAPEARCSVLLLDEGSSTLRHAAAPSLPEPYVAALGEVPVGPAVGSCGSAAYRRETVVSADVAADPAWSEYRDLAISNGLRACWSTPIASSNDERVIGTFAVYYDEPRSPSPEHIHLVELMVHLAAIAIERKAYESRLAYQANHDPLTGLPNRMLFLEFLVLGLARSRRFHSRVAVLFLDLDRFKFVNDSLGHDVGDRLLVALGERLREAVRPGDTVARFGGDEFVVLCEDLSGPDARRKAIDVAERLLAVIGEPFRLDGDEHYLSASIGIALARSGDERPEALLRDADSAMYRAKDRGKARWELFDEAMRASALERVEIENALHRAIDRNEFRVVYQPVVALPDGRCIGAEALVRWQHPERGLLKPGEFVDLAEESGLIVPVGIWVVEEACRQAAVWEAAGDAGDFVVSVNLSGRQLGHPDTPDHVAHALAASGIDPGRLALEITESVLMDDADSTMEAIGALKGLGVGLSIDDFGTGYSSLGYLKRFPVDAVKIDRSFVAGLGEKQEDSAIVAAVVGLGHALGLNVVAEGVETPRQRDELIALSCDAAQGFLFSPPVPAANLNGLRPGARVRL
jgi:diguanylate cyclase (GGDEF)-like protein/PAS domain S-box-containing protein